MSSDRADQSGIHRLVAVVHEHRRNRAVRCWCVAASPTDHHPAVQAPPMVWSAAITTAGLQRAHSLDIVHPMPQIATQRCPPLAFSVFSCIPTPAGIDASHQRPVRPNWPPDTVVVAFQDTVATVAAANHQRRRLRRCTMEPAGPDCDFIRHPRGDGHAGAGAHRWRNLPPTSRCHQPGLSAGSTSTPLVTARPPWKLAAIALGLICVLASPY